MKKIIKKEKIWSYSFYIKKQKDREYYEVYCNKWRQPYSWTVCFNMMDSLYFYHKLFVEVFDDMFSWKIENIYTEV